MIRRVGRDEQGAVAVTVALLLMAFVVTTALVVDIGYWYNVRRQMQSVADAARCLELTTGNLVHFIQSDPKIWDQANRIRAAYGCKPLR